MKRSIILAVVFLLCFSYSFGKTVELDKAQRVAASFLNIMNGGLKSVSANELVSVRMLYPAEKRFSTFKSAKIDSTQLVYLFKKPDNGFILISGDDRANPVLAYSLTEKLEETNLPVNFLKWIDEYKSQIIFIKKSPELKNSAVTSNWEMLENGLKIAAASPIAVNPLITTKWDQAPYYNELCPQAGFWSDKAVTGCVATAMAQVMKYHNYPKQGTGIHSYYHSSTSITYGNLSANYGATTYDWVNMPNSLNANSTATQINAVATLMLHCGIGVDMDYSPQSSGAWVVENKSQYETCAEYALKQFFAYDANSVRGVEREGKTTNAWIQQIKTELDAKRPVLFAGVGNGGGHAFVGDGYDNNNYIHINWGWSGIADGFYSVDAFNPVDLGTGAGSGSYNWYQQVIIGIKPQALSTSNSIGLYSDISIPTIYQLNAFEISMKIANLGPTNFNGDVGAALFNENGDFVEFIQSYPQQLESNFYYTITFSNDGLSVYPGTYLVGIYYKPANGNWIAVDENGYKNFVPIEILSPFEDSDIALYDSIKVNPRNIISGQSVTVSAKIANFGKTTYNGEFAAGLFDSKGEVVQTIELIDASGLESNYYNTFSFTNNKIDAKPGSYLIALVHFPANSEDQLVISPSTYINPIVVNVVVPPLQPDDFENNDLVSNSYEFPVTFENNWDGFYTLGTNLHANIDEDYYMLDLPSGFDYEINARVHDSYSSALNEDFSCDVIWAHSDNGEWTELYDDEMPQPYMLKNGGEIYFGVIAYNEGQTGTYSIAVQITRKPATNEVVALEPTDFIKVFPNPVSDRINIKSGSEVTNYELYDATGRKVLFSKIDRNDFSIDVSGLKSGIYQLKLVRDNRIDLKKITIYE